MLVFAFVVVFFTASVSLFALVQVRGTGTCVYKVDLFCFLLLKILVVTK